MTTNREAILAHRLMWRLVHGSIPEGMHVLHRCDNPRCINPDHLWLGTHADNMHDCNAKGRRNPPRGERASALAKLTEIKVRNMHKRVMAGETRKSLAEYYGITYSAVEKIIRGARWPHIFAELHGTKSQPELNLTQTL